MIRRLLIAAALATGLSSTANAALPADADTLRNANDPDLQASLEARLDELSLDSSVAAGQLSVALVDVTDPQRPQQYDNNKLVSALLSMT